MPKESREEQRPGRSEGLKAERIQSSLKAERIQDQLKAERIQSKLKAERIQALLARVPAWSPSDDGRSLERLRHFPTLRSSGLFAQLVLEIGEANGLAPEITIRHLEVTLTIPGSEDDGIRESDFNLARLLDGL